jgi:hypothetical protein
MCSLSRDSDPLFQLSQQLDRTGILTGGKCGYSANGKGRHRLEQLGELARRTRIETAIGTLGRAGDLAEDLLDLPVITFLKYEGGHAQASELTGCGDDVVRLLLECHHR